MYVSIDSVVHIIQHLVQGTQLVKMDLEDAYQVIQVHPHDRHLLGILWQDHVYVDHSLPFGLRSAPKIFTAFTDMVTWAIHCHGVRFLLHYVDDFSFLGKLGTLEAPQAVTLANEVFSCIGIPVATHKTVTYLGIILMSTGPL